MDNDNRRNKQGKPDKRHSATPFNRPATKSINLKLIAESFRAITPVEDIAENIPADDLFGGQVKGEELEGDNIPKGAMVIFRKAHDPSSIHDGTIICALEEKGARIGHLHREPDGRIRLAYSNREYPDNLFAPEEITILGIAIRMEIDLRQTDETL